METTNRPPDHAYVDGQLSSPPMTPRRTSHEPPKYKRMGLSQLAQSSPLEFIEPIGQGPQFHFTRPQSKGSSSRPSDSEDNYDYVDDVSDDESDESDEESTHEEVRSYRVVGEAYIKFTLEELDSDSDYDSDIEVVRPDDIEDAESDRSCSRQEDRGFIEKFKGLDLLRSSSDEEERERMYRRRKKRFNAGKFTAKRAYSQSVEGDSSYSDNDPLDDVDPTARRLRRRVRGPGDRSSLIFEDRGFSNANNIAEVWEPEDDVFLHTKGPPSIPSDDAFNLDELPFWGNELISDTQEMSPEAIENASVQENALEMSEVDYPTVPVEVLKQPPSTPPIEGASYTSKLLSRPSAQTHHWMFSLFGVIILPFENPIPKLGWLWHPPIPLGYARVSWTCRCGKRLYADFEKKHLTAAVEFAKQAAGPSNEHTVSSRSSESDTSTASSKSRSLNSPNSSPEGDILETSPSSASSVGDSQLDSIIPDEKKRYLLLCVNSEIHRIDLAHVDLTPQYQYGVPSIKDDQSLFKSVKEEYARLRGNKAKNIFIVPKTIQFIKFELIYRRLSGECVGNFEVDRIPSKDEAKRFGYHFKPCPPDIGKLPIMPHIFMHSFREPGDHTGSVVVERLPKKVGEKLGAQEYPGFGWGIHIIEGYNWKLLRKFIIGALFVTFILMLLWGMLRKDTQGGLGIGQYSVAVLTLALSVIALELCNEY